MPIFGSSTHVLWHSGHLEGLVSFSFENSNPQARQRAGSTVALYSVCFRPDFPALLKRKYLGMGQLRPNSDSLFWLQLQLRDVGQELKGTALNRGRLTVHRELRGGGLCLLGPNPVAHQSG